MRKEALAIATGLALMSFSANTLAWGKIVFDPTNYVKTGISAAQSIKQVTEQIESKLVLYRQIEEMLRHGKRIQAEVMAAGRGIVGITELGKNISSLSDLKRRVDTLKSTIDTSQARFNYVQNVASRYGLTASAYLERAKAKAENGDNHAQAMLQENARAMEEVNSTYQAVQQWEQKNPGQDSQLSALQALNQQMSAVVKMNARYMEFMAQQSTNNVNKEREKEVEDEVKKEALQKKIDDLNAAADAKQTEIKKSLSTMGTTGQ